MQIFDILVLSCCLQLIATISYTYGLAKRKLYSHIIIIIIIIIISSSSNSSSSNSSASNSNRSNSCGSSINCEQGFLTRFGINSETIL
jgi:hypothetical protein